MEDALLLKEFRKDLRGGFQTKAYYVFITLLQQYTSNSVQNSSYGLVYP